MKTGFSIILILASMLTFGQALESSRVVIVNDSILAMGLTQGRPQVVVAAPVTGRSIIVQSIDVRYKVNDRLYSPTLGTGEYVIGYKKAGYWYDVATLPFEQLNEIANTTRFFSPVLNSKMWDESQTDGAPLMIKFRSPMNFTEGSNKLTIFITYRILN